MKKTAIMNASLQRRLHPALASSVNNHRCDASTLPLPGFPNPFFVAPQLTGFVFIFLQLLFHVKKNKPALKMGEGLHILLQGYD